MRNGLEPLTRNVTDIFDAPTEQFDAFVTAPLERFELKSEPLVDGEALCAHLRARGFRSCRAQLAHYDPARFHRETTGRWCVVQQGTVPNWYPVYPLRTASQLSGISNCLRAIQEAETSEGQYDWIVLARLDVLRFVRWHGHGARKGLRCTQAAAWNATGPWWPTLAQHELVVYRTSRSLPFQIVEDRFIVGKRAALLPLEGLYRHFVSDRMPHHWKRGPWTAEYALANFFEHSHGTRWRAADRGTLLGAIDRYVSMEPYTDVGPNTGTAGAGAPLAQKRMPDRLGQCFFDELMRHLKMSREAAQAMLGRHGRAHYPTRPGVEEDRFGGCHPWLFKRLVNNDSGTSGCGEHDAHFLEERKRLSPFEEYMFRHQVSPAE